jgi:flagellar M-ring protein FliF
VDRVTERSSTTGGRIARLTVAVLVDGTYKGDHNEQFVPRDKAELERLEQLVRGAVGFSAARGDVIHVDTAPFSHPDASEMPAPPSPVAVLLAKRPWITYALAGALAATAAAAVAVARRKQKAKAAQLAAARPSPTDTLALDAAHQQVQATASDNREQLERLRAEALEIAARDPATAANILREWLNASSMGISARI